MKLRKFLPMAVLAVLPALASVLFAERAETSLDGEWRFALDPVESGREQEWFNAPAAEIAKWDKVQVPHCFSADARYHNFTGSAWYLRKFPAPVAAGGHRTFLRFEAAFYHVEVWLNGQKLGEHEGGYTPFEFDVTGRLAAENLVAVRVNNAWSRATLPGAKTRVPYQTMNYGQMYPWMNYGGLTRQVRLVVRPDVFIANTKVDATPDLAAGTARLEVKVFLRNASAAAWEGAATLKVCHDGKEIPVQVESARQTVAANGDAVLHVVTALAPADVTLWSFDHPALYEAEIGAGPDTVKTTFGIRSFTRQGTKLLLNGEPVALGGGNRPLDNPGLGSRDPPDVIERDLRLMKAGGMELSRIAHCPVSSELLDWADRHGMLLIGEAGNWQMTPEQMADPVMREKFKSQMREMVERDWNHPSLIAWSLGNEYQSQSDEGQAWTRDMLDFTRALDATRLITFATFIAARPQIKRPEEEASQYVDFISANIYENHLENLKRIHALYPDKPVYVSEFGIRADGVPSEQGRVDYLRKAVADFRACADFVVGASVWTFNDYASIFPGSNANGYRPWGLVAPDRSLRDMYRAWQEEFTPAIVTVRHAAGDKLEITVAARSDFPAYTLRGYTVRVRGQALALGTLAPGASTTVVATGPVSGDDEVVLEKPGGFAILTVKTPAR